MRSQISGLSKMQKRLSTYDFVAVPTGTFLRDWREDLKNEAIDRAPDWRGEIIRSLMSNQDTNKFPLWARVFADTPHARWAEFGTGELSEDPKSPKQAYFPPPEALRDWSASKGLDPYLVALGIFERGGTPPTHFFSDAERAADARFQSKIMRFGKAIERQAAIVP